MNTISGFHVEDSGGNGPAVLFLHGNLMDLTMWDGVLGALAGYRCVRFDFRLHGSTEDDGLPFTYWDAARDAPAVLDALGVPAAHFVGHSQGGFAALRAALLAPERVRSLALIDTAAGAFPGGALAEMARIRDGFAAGAVTATGKAVLDLLMGDGGGEAGARWPARVERQPADRLARAVGVLMGADDITGRLAGITAPALVVHGTADAPIPVEAGKALASALSARLELLDGAGHTPPVTHPGPTGSVLRRFLDDVPAGRT